MAWRFDQLRLGSRLHAQLLVIFVLWSQASGEFRRALGLRGGGSFWLRNTFGGRRSLAEY